MRFSGVQGICLIINIKNKHIFKEDNNFFLHQKFSISRLTTQGSQIVLLLPITFVRFL